MAFIVGKKQDGKTYYYLAESARVEGKPRIVSQRYLGSAEGIAAGSRRPDLASRIARATSPSGTSRRCGSCWGVFASQRSSTRWRGRVAATQGRRGTYIALATLNRVVDPCSKLAFSDWWDKTACDRWLRLPPGALDHRRFWEAMDAIGEDDLQEIERRIVSAMVETFSIDSRASCST